MMARSLWIFAMVAAIAITIPLARGRRRKESEAPLRNSSRDGLMPATAANVSNISELRPWRRLQRLGHPVHVKSYRCGRGLKALRAIARSVTHKHDDHEQYFDKYFHRLLDGSRRVSSAEFQRLVTVDICKKCSHVQSYLQALKTCGKKTARFAHHTSVQYNKVKTLLVTWAGKRNFFSVGEMCRCGADRVDSEHCRRRATQAPSRKSSTRRSRRVVSWKVVRQCRHFATLECGSRTVNHTAGYPGDVECGLWTNHTDGLFSDVENETGHHNLPELPDFAKHPWRPHIDSGDSSDDDDENKKELKDDLEHHTASLLVLKCVTGVAAGGFAIIIALYVYHKGGKMAGGRLRGSSTSVSTTLTDTGEYYVKKSPLDILPDTGALANEPDNESDDEVEKITKHGWHNPVYDVMEEAGAVADGPETEL